MHTGDTIAAVATPAGSGGIGIIRISGPEAFPLLARLFRAQSGVSAAEMDSHRLYYGGVYAPEDGLLLDRGLAVCMRAPHSYTGEDVAELQLHGGMRLLRLTLSAALRVGARLAEPGEFSLRAFLNGRLDLAQAEAVQDVIAAQSRRAVGQAAANLAGGLSARVAALERELIEILALITVGVDFPDDADAPDEAALLARLRAAINETEQLLKNADCGRLYREGLPTALIGAVNVGKSSLLNRLLDTDRAIVTDQPGTTRDLIEESVDIDGLPLILCDTAGFRAGTGDQAEQLGMARSRVVLSQARLILLVIDASRDLDQETIDLLWETWKRPRLLLLNKCDIASPNMLRLVKSRLESDAAADDIIPLSARTGEGIPRLRMAILRKAGAEPLPEAELPLVSNLRHQQALLRAQESLGAAIEAVENGLPADIAGIDIEEACSALGEISGRTVSEQVLNEIFSRFCLGK